MFIRGRPTRPATPSASGRMALCLPLPKALLVQQRSVTGPNASIARANRSIREHHQPRPVEP